jgi:hypothetical protein
MVGAAAARQAVAEMYAYQRLLALLRAGKRRYQTSILVQVGIDIKTPAF